MVDPATLGRCWGSQAPPPLFRQVGSYNPWSENMPSGRVFHAMVTGNDRSIYMFGGFTEVWTENIRECEPISGHRNTNTFMKLDVDTGIWTSMDAAAGITGTPPSTETKYLPYLQLYGIHPSMTLVGQDIYLFELGESVERS